MKRIKNIMVGGYQKAAGFVKRNATELVLVGGTVAAKATDAPPIDLSAAGTTIAGYVPTAAGYALPIFIAIVAVGVVLRVFSRVGGH